MIKRSITSVVDQALLSGLNFLVGLYLIAAVPKDAYGLYVQLFAVGVLSCAVLDALIANALANLSSRLSSDEMATKVVSAQLLARLLGFVLALVGMGLAYGLQSGVQHGMGRLQLAFAFGCYLAALSFRDFKRVLLYLEQRTLDVMKLDGILWQGTFGWLGASLGWHRVPVICVVGSYPGQPAGFVPYGIQNFVFLERYPMVDIERCLAGVLEHYPLGSTRFGLGLAGHKFVPVCGGFSLGAGRNG